MPESPPMGPVDGPAGTSSTTTGSDVTTVVVENGLQDIVRSEGVTDNLVPGDLGQRLITNQTADLVQRAYRVNSAENVQRSWNHRFRGQREAFKFNLLMQQVLTLSALVFATLEPRNRSLRVQEFLTGPASSTTAANSEVALICHIRAQIDFKEWLLLRDADIKWFNP